MVRPRYTTDLLNTDTALRRLTRVLVIGALLTTLVAASTASADTLEPGEIDEDESYQFDNYVVEVTKSYNFDSDNKTKQYVELTLYEIGTDGELDQIKSMDDSNGRWILRYGEGHEVSGGEVLSITVDDEVEEGEITLEYVDATSTTAEIKIKTDWDVDYTDGLQEASDATFIGKPVLDVEKTVSSSNIDVGQVITVTVKAENTGPVKATDIRVTNPQDEGFVLDEYLVDQSMVPSSVGADDTKTLLKYRLKATSAGTKRLSSTEVDYGREADSASYESNSTRPTVSVAESEAEVSASLSSDTDSISTGGTVRLSVLMEETGGKSSARDVVVKIDAPEEAEFAGLVDEEDDGGPEVEIIGGNDLQITLPNSIEPGKSRELEMEYTIGEPDGYDFSGEVNYAGALDSIGSAGVGKTTVALDDVDVTVGATTMYKATHQPIYVYATPVVVAMAFLGWVAYRRQQYKF